MCKSHLHHSYVCIRCLFTYIEGQVVSNLVLFFSGSNLSEMLLMQYLRPVGAGPSGNT